MELVVRGERLRCAGTRLFVEWRHLHFGSSQPLVSDPVDVLSSDCTSLRLPFAFLGILSVMAIFRQVLASNEKNGKVVISFEGL